MILDSIIKIYNESSTNCISPEKAICPEIAGVKFFEEPLVKFGSARDELFEKFKEPGIIGPWFQKPEEWMKEGKTVVSLFFPFTKEVRESNRKCAEIPSNEWLHGRIEGQAFLTGFMNELKDWFEENGTSACVPSNNEKFRQVVEGEVYGSNWSERHVAYVCGMGTFGLSKGIITEKGMAGRLMSIIVDCEMETDERDYTEVYEYCTMCGACIKRCPANAITFENGKNHKMCDDWNRKIKEMKAPRFGCGICQTKVPCESSRPVKR
jgi:epoxyqueuosine reductase QueG